MKYVRLLVLLGTLLGAGAVVVQLAQSPNIPVRVRDADIQIAMKPDSSPGTNYDFVRLDSPARTEVLDDHNQLVATFTDGARSTVLVGPQRTFTDAGRTSAVVTSNSWVRLTPQPWHAGDEKAPWFRPWLDTELADRGPDLLAVATQYVSTAHYGDNADFYDYLGVKWQGHKPQPSQLGELDSAGYVRLVYGDRLGYPLDAGGLPRTPAQMATAPLGAVIADKVRGSAQARFLAQPGDLLLFAVTNGQAEQVDRVGIYLGVDDAGQPRFIACRDTPNGPSFGDASGPSVLDGNGQYAAGLRGIHRL